MWNFPELISLDIGFCSGITRYGIHQFLKMPATKLRYFYTIGVSEKKKKAIAIDLVPDVH
jgi:hypothetical protein